MAATVPANKSRAEKSANCIVMGLRSDKCGRLKKCMQKLKRVKDELDASE